MNKKKIKEHLREALKLAKKEGILGINTQIGRYYVMFSYTDMPKICTKCNQVIE